LIRGTIDSLNRDAYYIQTNNPTEEILRKQDSKYGGYLVSCGPTAAVNCISAMGLDVEISCPGDYKPQPEEVLMDYFNDPRNYDILRKKRKGTDPSIWYGNEVPQFYEIAVPAVFNVKARFIWWKDYKTIVNLVSKGQAVQLCLKNPGHYIAVVAYDTDTQEIIINDPWPGRFFNRDGFNRRMNAKELWSNVKGYAIVYG